jgi:hypothetical protein
MSKKKAIETSVASEEAELRAKLAELNRNRRPREVLEAIAEGAVPQGIRLVVPGNEEGIVFLPDPDEAAALAAEIQKLIEARFA